MSPSKPVERLARRRDGVARPARLFLDGDLDARRERRLDRLSRLGRARPRRSGRRRAAARHRAPSRPCAGRAAGAGASASSDRMRVPRPPAMTTAASWRRSFAAPTGGWGARIRTWDRGTKTRCLTTWLRPIRLGRRQSSGGRCRASRTSTTTASAATAMSGERADDEHERPGRARPSPARPRRSSCAVARGARATPLAEPEVERRPRAQRRAAPASRG